MTLEDRILLLKVLKQFLQSDNSDLKMAMQKSYTENSWFTIENQQQAIDAIANYLLDENDLETWMLKYPNEYFETNNPKKIGLVMAGNLPLVGFHDFLSVFITGHKAQIKLSSKDQQLFKVIMKFLIQEDPEVSSQIQVVEKLNGYDAVMATGSNNTNRYFEYYFKNVPNVLRKNRTSVALIEEDTSDEDLERLSNDCFDYFGMGCRNVSKLYLPEGFDFERIFKAFEQKADIQNHNKYKNNFDYNLAIYLLNNDDVKTNNWFTLKPSEQLFSPLSVLYYQTYQDSKQAQQSIAEQLDDIQCVVGNNKGQTKFGKAQQPKLWDYADGVDTINFLGSLQ